MTAEEIIALAVSLAIILIGGALLIVYLIKAIPRLVELEESQINKELIKARTEIRLQRKVIKVLKDELKYFETEYSQFATEDEWNNYLSNEIKHIKEEIKNRGKGQANVEKD